VAAYQSWDAAYSPADAERFLAQQALVGLGEPGQWIQVAIIDRAGGSLLGDCAVHVLTDQPRTAEIGVTLAAGAQGRGVGREALDALVTALIADRGMHRVIAQVDDRNHAMHRLCERLGFRLEATLVEADWFKGEWTTLRVYAVLAREWRRDGARR
jgi:RimJ/RimL family protein N-acetyltransferase